MRHTNIRILVSQSASHLLYFIWNTNTRFLVSQSASHYCTSWDTQIQGNPATDCISLLHFMRHTNTRHPWTDWISLLHFMRHTNTRHPCHRLNLIIALHETHKYKTSLPQTAPHYCTSWDTQIQGNPAPLCKPLWRSQSAVLYWLLFNTNSVSYIAALSMQLTWDVLANAGFFYATNGERKRQTVALDIGRQVSFAPPCI